MDEPLGGPTDRAMEWASRRPLGRAAVEARPLGLKLLIAYKVAKAPIMVALAIWLTVSSVSAYALGIHLASVLADHHGLLHLAGAWLGVHLTAHAIAGARLLAWLDGAATAAEAVLLLLGKPWGEWIVTGVLALLLPAEVYGLVRHPHFGRFAVFLVSLAVVAYLVRRQLTRHAAAQARRILPSRKRTA